uniref:Uncharacterized protein n=1 Tax=Glossina brevipalpis TaxID=37001 RepID=A0A1A9WPK3_9MUSC
MNKIHSLQPCVCTFAALQLTCSYCCSTLYEMDHFIINNLTKEQFIILALVVGIMVFKPQNQD